MATFFWSLECLLRISVSGATLPLWSFGTLSEAWRGDSIHLFTLRLQKYFFFAQRHHSKPEKRVEWMMFALWAFNTQPFVLGVDLWPVVSQRLQVCAWADWSPYSACTRRIWGTLHFYGRRQNHNKTFTDHAHEDTHDTATCALHTIPMPVSNIYLPNILSQLQRI